MASHTPNLSDSQWMLIEDALHRLEEAWHSESSPDIEVFLAGLEPPLRETALIECIKIDMEYHWRTTRPVFLEAYLQRWPALIDNPSGMLELLEAECSTRAIFSIPAERDELERRFGAWAEQIDLDQIERQASQDRVTANDDDSVPEHISTTTETPTHRDDAPPVYLPLTMGQTFGRYKIRGQLGGGGEGNVYRAYDRQMDREVALKFPRYADSEVFERFLRQSKMAAKLEHRNICRVYDAGSIGGVHFIAMALIRGVTIQEKLEQSGPFDYEEAVTLVRCVASALGRVHEAEIIHRDIKSANIMIDPEGEPILMDFGLARSIEHSVGMTTTGAFAGTLAFMSPEVAAGNSADEQSDIYGLGVVLYQMLTGQVPFSVVPTELLRHLGKSPAPSPRTLQADIPPELDAICRRAMAPCPEDRYPTADEFGDALQRFQAGQPQKYKPPRRPHSRWFWPAIIGTFAAILLGAFLLRGDAPPDEVPASPVPTAKVPQPERQLEPVARQVDRWIDTPEPVAACAVTQDGQRAFVVVHNQDDIGRVREIDLATGKQLGETITIAEFMGTYDLALSADERHLYVISFYSNFMADIDLEGGRTVTKVPIVAEEKIASDPVWWRWGNRLRITPDGQKIVIPMGNEEWPDQEVDPDDPDSLRSMRARTVNDQLSIVDLSGNSPRLLKEIPLDDEPLGGGFCISADSRYAYFATRPRPSTDTPKLYEVELQSPYRIRTLEFPDAKLVSVEISNKLGKVYVCDRAHRRIWVVDRDTFGTEPPREFCNLNGRTLSYLAIDEENDLLVASSESHSLHFLDAVDGRWLGRVEGLRPEIGSCPVFTPDRKAVIVASSQPGGIGVVSVPSFQRKIAFQSSRGGSTQQLYTMDLDGTNITPVLSQQSFASDVFPRWSPDGQTLAFCSDRDIKPRICLVRYGETDVKLFEASSPVLGLPFDWSPSGKHIVYVNQNRTALHLLNVATGEVAPLEIELPDPYREIVDVCWPTVNQLFTAVMPIRNAIQGEVFRIALEGPTVEQLTFKTDKPTGCVEVAVAHDGRIAVLRQFTNFQNSVRAYLLHEARPMEEALELIANTDPSISGYVTMDWFPDGQKIIFSARENEFYGHICVFDLATGKTEILTHEVGIDAAPHVSVRLADLPQP